MRSNVQRLIRLSARVARAALAIACMPHNVRVDYDQDATFLGRHTFAWADSAGVVRDNTSSPFLERRVRRAIDQAMIERGFTRAAVGAQLEVLVTAFVVGPTATEERAWNWSTAPCGPAVMVRIGPRDPF